MSRRCWCTLHFIRTESACVTRQPSRAIDSQWNTHTRTQERRKRKSKLERAEKNLYHVDERILTNTCGIKKKNALNATTCHWLCVWKMRMESHETHDEKNDKHETRRKRSRKKKKPTTINWNCVSIDWMDLDSGLPSKWADAKRRHSDFSLRSPSDKVRTTAFIYYSSIGRWSWIDHFFYWFQQRIYK